MDREHGGAEGGCVRGWVGVGGARGGASRERDGGVEGARLYYKTCQ